MSDTVKKKIAIGVEDFKEIIDKICSFHHRHILNRPQVFQSASFSQVAFAGRLCQAIESETQEGRTSDALSFAL